MEIMHTMASEAMAPNPKRRFYSPELKARVVAQCRADGASIAAVAPGPRHQRQHRPSLVARAPGDDAQIYRALHPAEPPSIGG
jgi:hypothetical protein